jgi:hypothetical protein
LTELYHLLGMKSFRDDLIDRMKTGWGRFVLASFIQHVQYIREREYMRRSGCHCCCLYIMAGKPSWEQANRRQKLGLVWRIRKKISQIIKDYFYLPFFLLIILCSPPSECVPPSPPPPLVRGEDTLAGWRGEWGVNI